MNPGELISRQREQLLWTQGMLAAHCGVAQSHLSRYETGAAHPTWDVLSRILGAMGTQPTVDATDCDLTFHVETATLRAAGVGGWRQLWGFEPDGVEPSRVMALPGDLRADDHGALIPLVSLCGTTSWALTGTIALRLLGLACTVPVIEATVFGQPEDDVAAPAFCAQVASRLTESGMEIWCPETGCHRRIVSAESVADIVERAQGKPVFRTRATATRVVVTLSSGQRPPHVAIQLQEVVIPVLGLNSVASRDDPDSAAVLRRAAKSLGSGKARW